MVLKGRGNMGTSLASLKQGVDSAQLQTKYLGRAARYVAEVGGGLFSSGPDTHLALIFKTVFFVCVWVYVVTPRWGTYKKERSLAMVTTQENGPVMHHFLSSRIHSPRKHIITLISERMRNSASKEKSHRQATRPARKPRV